MSLELQILKKKRTWSGWFVLTGLCRLLVFLSRPWDKCFPTHTPLGGTRRRLGELPKSLFQFRQAWTNNYSPLNVSDAFRWARQDLVVSESNNLPSLFFKVDTANKVFATLSRKVVRRSIHFYNYPVIQEGEVNYRADTKEWVLGPVTLSLFRYLYLQPRLRAGWVRIESGPVTEKHRSESAVQS